MKNFILRHPDFFISLFLLIVGIPLCYFSISSLISNTEFMKHAEKHTATITKIYEYHEFYENDTLLKHGNTYKKMNYTVFVSYNINGQTYTNELGYYDSNMKEGNNITIYVNPKFPNAISYNHENLFLWVISSVGIIIIIFAIINYIRSKTKNRYRKDKYFTQYKGLW